MKKIVKYLAILCVFIGCSSEPTNNTAVSVNAIPKDTLIAVLVDVNILEASVNLNQLSGTTNTDKYYDVFKKHNITRAQYDESLREYAKDPKELSAMYDQVIEKLSKMQAEINK